MESNWATEHLQVIRTLMERSAVYRRALAPVMIFAGVLGLVGAGVGWKFAIYRPVPFIAYWYAVGTVVLIGAFLLVRRQAWKHAEPFWSPPTRRVAQALLPPLTAGFLLGVLVVLAARVPASPNVPTAGSPPNWWVLVALPLAWVILYGCALHAAGFFMPRGMKIFGWIFVVCGFMAVPVTQVDSENTLILVSYGIMGAFFGALHLAYGVYLYFTEQPANET